MWTLFSTDMKTWTSPLTFRQDVNKHVTVHFPEEPPVSRHTDTEPVIDLIAGNNLTKTFSIIHWPSPLAWGCSTLLLLLSLYSHHLLYSWMKKTWSTSTVIRIHLTGCKSFPVHLSDAAVIRRLYSTAPALTLAKQILWSFFTALGFNCRNIRYNNCSTIWLSLSWDKRCHHSDCVCVPNQKNIIFLFSPVEPFMHLDYFGVSLWSFWDEEMSEEMSSSSLTCTLCCKKHIWKNQQQCLFQGIQTLFSPKPSAIINDSQGFANPRMR